jgi:bifunctional non-homologous end joining protein LigD
MKSVSLYFCQGSSDKEYHAQVQPKGAGWVVNFQYGRRGSSLTTGTKTQAPVSREEAEHIFDRLVAEKKGKGYTEGEAGTPFAGDSTKDVSGVVPQLLNPVDEDAVEALIADDRWCAQEKLDGRNRLLRIGAATVEGINKLGLVVAIPQPIHDTALRFGPGLLAGEEIGDTLYVFDLLEHRGRDLRALPYRQRYLGLTNAFAAMPSHHRNAFVPVETAWTTEAKRRLLADLRAAKAEGIVFKDVRAPYNPGRPSSGGPQLKLKFCQTCSAIVAAVNAKRSVALQLLADNGAPVDVGNVTIPPNQPVPPVGAVVEVRYLYAYPGGSLYQPVYLGVRDDVTRAECGARHIKFKRDEAA